MIQNYSGNLAGKFRQKLPSISALILLRYPWFWGKILPNIVKPTIGIVLFK